MAAKHHLQANLGIPIARISRAALPIGAVPLLGLKRNF